MTSQEILTLLSAGYTKEEITAMDTQAEPEEQEPEQEETEPAEPQEPEENPGNNDSVNAELSAVREELSNTRKQLNQLIKQMQSSNLKTASINILPESDLEKKTDEAMAELIRPKFERSE